MSDQKRNSDDSTLPTGKPQAPDSISVESVDRNSRLAPANPGSTSNIAQGPLDD